MDRLVDQSADWLNSDTPGSMSVNQAIFCLQASTQDVEVVTKHLHKHLRVNGGLIGQLSQ